ncbi:septation protein A [Herbaspirillum rubrisubalbicans]|jgi:intracellular septation protein|uniref:Inner membrane-spanning protein YciB n=1 Tax=Herbaspirillum rubrisubalbicans TaxID=80842 RepID=A0AAD0U788_9BURK|nr:septation protein A [Herbaspirillum rubrisubalbicans]AYR24374.1 septation protein A [Herbaspirillum rubrisubalbicans]MCP1572289.1 intracellular septation protein [Herbaspirillum rubrisubalbicans]NQE51100.1 septation protein A [Herbaspirillum rubrisubalbicans]RAM66408.1 septation protein A [Herbaspirillum rubrisubalbicans]RAN49402.1 septation protein A [Herbaspirillum rubrisubalbicans]
MKFLFDLFPVILFFGVFKWAEGHPSAAQDLVMHYLGGAMSAGAVTATQAPILLSTAVAIIASLGQIAWLLLRRRKVDAMLWVSLAIIVVFGGATIYFRDDTFIKWKPTILYWCFGVALLGSQWFMKKNLIRVMMEKQVTLPEPIWPRLNLAWIVFFAVMGVLNLYIAFNYPLDTWVNFKMFGSMGLMFAFIIGQSLFLSKYMKDEQ